MCAFSGVCTYFVMYVCVWPCFCAFDGVGVSLVLNVCFYRFVCPLSGVYVLFLVLCVFDGAFVGQSVWIYM